MRKRRAILDPAQNTQFSRDSLGSPTRVDQIDFETENKICSELMREIKLLRATRSLLKGELEGDGLNPTGKDGAPDTEISAITSGKSSKSYDANTQRSILCWLMIRLYSASITRPGFTVDPFSKDELRNIELHLKTKMHCSRSNTPISEEGFTQDTVRRNVGEGRFNDIYGSNNKEAFTRLAHLVGENYPLAFEDVNGNTQDSELKAWINNKSESYDDQFKIDESSNWKLMAWLLMKNDEKTKIDINCQDEVEKEYSLLIENYDVSGFKNLVESLEGKIGVGADLDSYFSRAREFADQAQKKKLFHDMTVNASNQFNVMLEISMAGLFERYESDDKKSNNLQREIKDLTNEVKGFFEECESDDDVTLTNLPLLANSFIDTLLNNENEYPVLAKPAYKTMVGAVFMRLIHFITRGLRGSKKDGRRRSNERLQKKLPNLFSQADSTKPERKPPALRPRL